MPSTMSQTLSKILSKTKCAMQFLLVSPVKKQLTALLKTTTQFQLFGILLTSLLGSISAQAQTFGNEWINFSQEYYKIPVTAKGIYRITVNDLTAAGFPVSTVNPKRIQLYHRGKEQAILVNGEADEKLDANDYVEFYGKGNDGTMDSLLYIPSSAQPHKYYSLYSDTTAYFLTWRIDNGVGKRMDNFIQANVLNIPVEPFHLEENLRLLTDEYAEGQVYPEGTLQEIILSQYDHGEGWTGKYFNKATNIDFSFSLPRLVSSNTVKPKVEIMLVGRNNRQHNVELSVGTSTASLRSLGNAEYQYYRKQLMVSDLEPGDISASGTLTVRVRANGYADEPNDRNSICYVRIVYPQNFDMTGTQQKYIKLLPATNGTRSYIEIPNPPTGIRVYDITDPNTIRTIGGAINNSKFTAIVNNTLFSRTLFANTGFLSVLPIRRVGFRNINAKAHNYLVVSHRNLMKPVGGYPDAVRAYAGYRASTAGGGYDTLVVDVDMLYNQFNYGEYSPLAIRRFADYMLHNGKPEFLFLIGTSWAPQFGRKNPNRNNIDLVPTAGSPGSDIMLTAGLNGGMPNAPAIPTGRLNVHVPTFPEQEVFPQNANYPLGIINYLNKVKEHESSPLDNLWRKNLLHLSGGKNPYELITFKSFVNEFKSVAESKYLGGKVTTLSKKTDNAVEFINVVDQVNKGLGIITFFGHSGAGVTDINVGFASRSDLGYTNKGKYPFLLVNGCEAGNIFYGIPTFGSDWIQTADKGAILFLAHSYLGYPYPLRSYSNHLYETLLGDSTYIHKPFGIAHSASIRRYLANTDSDYDVSNAQQLTLQGDPAVAIFPAKKADYAIDNTKLFLRSFTNETITAAVDSFQLGIIASNYGIVNPTPFSVAVQRTLSNGTILRYDTLLYPPVNYQDTLYFTIKNRNSLQTTAALGGSNFFDVKVDARDSIAELNENNNVARLEYLFPSQAVVALFPKEYSIVNAQTSSNQGGIPVVNLVAQATQSTTQSRSYVFELDTTAAFNSPAKRSQTFDAGFLPTWKASLLNGSQTHDSTVYYWRARYADRPADDDNVWTESSFVYITNSPEGWSQSQFPQFTKSTDTHIEKNATGTQWKYTPITTQLNITTIGASSANAYKQTRLLLNDLTVVSGGTCGDRMMVAVAFNKSTKLPYSVFPDMICRSSTPFVTNFMYDDNIINSNNLLGQYIDAVPTGDYILLFTMGSISFTNWSAALKQKLVDIGADPTKVSKLKTGHPYIILGQKGAAPGTAVFEILADYDNVASPTTQTINRAYTLNGSYNQGSVASSLIGPASEWGSVYQKITTNNSLDAWKTDIIGINSTGIETVIQEDVTTTTFSLSSIDAKQYPYLRLKLHTEDTENQTTPQLNKWLVTYKGVPEGILNQTAVKNTEYTIADKQEGETFNVTFVFQNISPRNFEDSLTFRHTVINKTTREQTTGEWKVKKLVAGDSVLVTLPIQTLGKAGENTLRVVFNPRLLSEEYYDNNVMEVPFRVKPDRTNPVLDVAFDGTHIMNGDIVSPSPLITVSLKDENQYMIRKDTVGLRIALKQPCKTCVPQDISFNSPEVRYTPAQAGSNDFRVEYHPKNLADGIYTLEVSGKDVSKNDAGEAYRINFEVVNESKVTNFYPYPNPFSSKTKFVFTLTGADIPDQIKIQIMTVTGRIVRDITQQELGPIHIGNNITDFAWDGTDEFGDKLANGVYLYRVVVRSNGQDLQQRQTSADKSFTKGYGKIYILR